MHTNKKKTKNNTDKRTKTKKQYTQTNKNEKQYTQTHKKRKHYTQTNKNEKQYTQTNKNEKQYTQTNKTKNNTHKQTITLKTMSWRAWPRLSSEHNLFIYFFGYFVVNLVLVDITYMFSFSLATKSTQFDGIIEHFVNSVKTWQQCQWSW